MLSVGRSLGAVFLHHCRKSLFVNDGVQHLLDDAGRIIQCRFCQPKQQRGFTVHTLEITEEFFHHFLFSTHADAMDNPNEQFHQAVDHFLMTLPAEHRHQGIANQRWGRTHLARRFGRGSQPVALENLRRDICEKVLRQLQRV